MGSWIAGAHLVEKMGFGRDVDQISISNGCTPETTGPRVHGRMSVLQRPRQSEMGDPLSLFIGDRIEVCEHHQWSWTKERVH